MSCFNKCEGESLVTEKISQCNNVLTFDLGILNAEKDLIFNITGRSKRNYQIQTTTDVDGIADVYIDTLPVGYLSTFYKGFYKVHFINLENEIVEIRNTGKSCFQFQVSDIICLFNQSTNYLTQDTFNISILNKGNGDTITHPYGFKFRILTFFDSSDSFRQKNIFYSTSQTNTSFALSNDFDNDKYSGTLTVIKL